VALQRVLLVQTVVTAAADFFFKQAVCDKWA
jgi:hypothetical protein